MALIHNDVFDAALSYIKANAKEAEVQNASGTALVDAITLDSGNFGSTIDNSGSGGGRKIQCLVSSASDLQNISVNSAGSASKIALKDSAGTTTLIEASISSAPISLGASDAVNLSTFSIILKDPV
jgi:hypothetical protein